MNLTQLIIGACMMLAPDDRALHQHCITRYTNCTDKMKEMKYTETNKLRLCVIADNKGVLDECE